MTLAASFSTIAQVRTSENGSPTRTAPALVRHQHWIGSVSTFCAAAAGVAIEIIASAIKRCITCLLFCTGAGAPPPARTFADAAAPAAAWPQALLSQINHRPLTIAISYQPS